MSDEPREVATSPFRWLLVIVPVLVIAATATALLARWAMRWQATHGHERPNAAERAPRGVEAARSPLPGDHGGRPTSGPAPVDPKPRGGPSSAVSKAALNVTAVVAGLADADAEQGAATFRICLVCHVAEKGAPSRVGPNLWGIVGRPKASYPGFAYSESLRAKGGTWTYEDLAEFIHEPRRFVPGTRMAFRGIDENARLAQLIAHLRALSDSPAPLPVRPMTEPAALRGRGSAPR